MLSYLGAATAIEQSNAFAGLMPWREERFHCFARSLSGVLTIELSEAKPHDFDAVPVVSMPRRHAKEVLCGIA
jgi:hypothetical protein